MLYFELTQWLIFLILSKPSLSCKSVEANCLFSWGFSFYSCSGPVSSEALPNVNGMVVAFEAQLNGSVSPSAPPQSTSSPVNSQNQQSSPGVASYPPMLLEKSEGASAEVTVHTSDSLQSLRLSIPMQETELCKHKLMWSEFPLHISSLHFAIVLLWVFLLVLAPIYTLFVTPLFV